MHIEQITENNLTVLLDGLEAQYAGLKAQGLALDLTRGKPGAEQLALSDSLDGILKGKGLVNTREHMESLIESMDSGITTVQEYIGSLQEAADESEAEPSAMEQTS